MNLLIEQLDHNEVISGCINGAIRTSMNAVPQGCDDKWVAVPVLLAGYADMALRGSDRGDRLSEADIKEKID